MLDGSGISSWKEKATLGLWKLKSVM